ncbi:hypothetical protein PXH59_04940 [Xenorhabdus sp. SF857]|uniref:hypothetical protein n=1 Tax=Xenorhabdus bakwenae TaxID=3026967 RepID=UPI002557F374|nr:hypothetical protein [Xenorhabdus sp. SF857]WFQ80486.1 hypothetical protein PXH59_04940 [Xenorhabdus sp. SF857]
MTKHIHADLMATYAEMAQTDNEPWRHFQCKTLTNNDWDDCITPIAFWFDREYRLKPRTIKIGDIEVPEPVREPLEEYTEYYCPDINTFGTSDADCHLWDGDDNDKDRLQNGLIHLDRESAELHARALIALTATK